MRAHRFVRNLTAVLFTIVVSACAAATEQASSDHPIDEDEILVLDPPEDYLRHLPGLGLEVVDKVELPGMGKTLYHLRVTDGVHPFDVRTRHAEKFSDVIVDAHHHYEHHAAADRSYTARTATKWHAAANSCGAGIRIGIIDGDLDVKHQAFKGSRVAYKTLHLKGEQIAATGHGTAVAAIITGNGAWGGLLPGSEVIAANVFHKGKDGKAVGSAKAIVQAIDWMIQQKVPVINMSIGGGPNKLVEAAIQHADSLGVVMVASSGNEGPFSKKKSYPGAFPEVIAITAVDRFDRSANFASSGDYIDFAAPGVEIWTAVPGGGKAMSGTSFASPIAAAFAVAVLKRDGKKTADNIRAFFQEHALDRGKPGRDRYTGWGIVQVPPLCGAGS